MILPESSPAELEAQLSGTGPLRSVVPLPDGRVFIQGALQPPTRPGGLSDEQSAVVQAVTSETSPNILVIAGPGSGKTKTLIDSIVAAVRSGVAAEKIVAITFTNNAAAEMQVRLVEKAGELGLPALFRVQVSTFHAWAGQLAASRIDPWTYPPVNLRTASLAVALHLTNPDTATHTFTKAEVAAADRHLEGCETFTEMEVRNFNKIAAEKKNRTGFDNLAKAVAALEPHLRDSQIATYGTLMRSATTSATTLPPDSLRWLFIDEAQDLNRPQAEFVDAVKAQTGCRVFAIADDDQGIYKFRGASSQFLRDFGRQTGTKTFHLTRNFRSTTPIVALCRKWIEPNWTRLRTPEKKLHSRREGLPVVVLTANSPGPRGLHAKIILAAAKDRDLINCFGEVAVLDYSVNHAAFDLEGSKLKFRPLADRCLPPDILKTFLNLCRASKATGAWHHPLWSEFLDAVTAGQKAAGDPIVGHPGLADLYAALEAARRIQPDLTPSAFAKVAEGINAGREFDREKFFFLGDRPEPDYAADAVNYISLHSSKGMEFPVVWVTGGGFTLAVSEEDTNQGQPGVFGELWEWAKKSLSSASKPDPAELNKVAAELERRRLLYVGMSRATDLLIISAPPGNGKGKKDDGAFKAEIDKVLSGIDHIIISTAPQASDFAATIRASHRHPTWKPPHRYRVESFTSLTRQPLPGELREVEIPREREFPRPQSREAMIGDLFHRIMHLLCLEEGLITHYTLSNEPVETLIARVTTRRPADLHPLSDYLKNFFADEVNGIWKWLVMGSKSEVPFSHVTTSRSTGEACLLKGFIDLVRFDGPNSSPSMILDYKTGPVPALGSAEDLKHADQLRCYRDALAATYSCDVAGIQLRNYYVRSQEFRER